MPGIVEKIYFTLLTANASYYSIQSILCHRRFWFLQLGTFWTFACAFLREWLSVRSLHGSVGNMHFWVNRKDCLGVASENFGLRRVGGSDEGHRWFCIFGIVDILAGGCRQGRWMVALQTNFSGSIKGLAWRLPAKISASEVMWGLTRVIAGSGFSEFSTFWRLGGSGCRWMGGWSEWNFNYGS
jgi:hypothetical protein